MPIDGAPLDIALIGILSLTLLNDNLCYTPGCGQSRLNLARRATAGLAAHCRRYMHAGLSTMAQPAKHPEGILVIEWLRRRSLGGTPRRATRGPRPLTEAIVLILVAAH